MRATIRLADGTLVEGELVAQGYWVPPTVNAAGCAGNPSVVYDMQIPTAPMIVPSVAACAAAPCGVTWVGTR